VGITTISGLASSASVPSGRTPGARLALDHRRRQPHRVADGESLQPRELEGGDMGANRSPSHDAAVKDSGTWVSFLSGRKRMVTSR